MKSRFEAAKSYINKHRDNLTTAAILVALVVVVCGVVFFFVESSKPNIVYQPTKACDLLTTAKAKSLLGNAALTTADEAPVIGRETAVSKCGYTDGNPDMNSAVVAAVIVRSGINDPGDAKNKSEFAMGASGNSVRTVKDLGEKAYFNSQKGQLNILRSHDWIVISYGTGAAPETNTLEKALELARTILK